MLRKRSQHEAPSAANGCEPKRELEIGAVAIAVRSPPLSLPQNGPLVPTDDRKHSLRSLLLSRR